MVVVVVVGSNGRKSGTSSPYEASLLSLYDVEARSTMPSVRGEQILLTIVKNPSYWLVETIQVEVEEPTFSRKGGEIKPVTFPLPYCVLVNSCPITQPRNCL